MVLNLGKKNTSNDALVCLGIKATEEGISMININPACTLKHHNHPTRHPLGHWFAAFLHPCLKAGASGSSSTFTHTWMLKMLQLGKPEMNNRSANLPQNTFAKAEGRGNRHLRWECIVTISDKAETYFGIIIGKCMIQPEHMGGVGFEDEKEEEGMIWGLESAEISDIMQRQILNPLTISPHTLGTKNSTYHTNGLITFHLVCIRWKGYQHGPSVGERRQYRVSSYYTHNEGTHNQKHLAFLQWNSVEMSTNEIH